MCYADDDGSKGKENRTREVYADEGLKQYGAGKFLEMMEQSHKKGMSSVDS